MNYSDVGNVVAFSHACKGNFGSSRNCSANLVMAPGLRSMFGDRAGRGAPCAEQTNNGHGSTFADKYFQHNTCVQPVSAGSEVPAYLFQDCKVEQGKLRPDSVWGTKGNRFLVPRGSGVVVPCGGTSISLAEWQSRYGQDEEASVGDIPSIPELMAQARAVLDL
jgi:hypothetical protein